MTDEELELAEDYMRIQDYLEDHHGPWDRASLQNAIESIINSDEGIDEILNNPEQYPEYFK